MFYISVLIYSSKSLAEPFDFVSFSYILLRALDTFGKELSVSTAISDGLKPNLTRIITSNSNGLTTDFKAKVCG